MNKAKQINIRLTQGQYAILQAEALKREMTISEYIRTAATYLPKLEKEYEDNKVYMQYYKNIALSKMKWLDNEDENHNN